MDKERLENYILSEILNAPIESDILAYDGNVIVRNGRKLTAAETEGIIASARELANNDFFALLLAEMKRIGHERIGERSKEWEDVRFGKACLYIADLMQKKVETTIRLPKPKQEKAAT